jgi:hypothetical protein
MTKITMIPVLQYRWKMEYFPQQTFLVYYGLRNPPGELRQKIALDNETAEILRACDGRQTLGGLLRLHKQTMVFYELIAEKIVVDLPEKKTGPFDMQSARICTRCVNNDYVIPGLEFDEQGVCAFCQCYERGLLNAHNPLQVSRKEDLLRLRQNNRTSRFDVMLLYTGGKDSSYLLWYLAKKLNLRVLAASWNMPYTNVSTRNNMESAKKCLPNVEFVDRTLPWDVAREAMRGQLHSYGLPCLCPTVAYALLYPLAFQEKIPCIINGVEEVQMSVRDYIFPLRQKDPSDHVPSERETTLTFLEFLLEDRPFVQPLEYAMEVANYHGSIRKQVPELYGQLREIVERAEKDPTLSIPHIRRIDTNTVYGEWGNVAELIKKELGWQMPEGQTGLLHTSCSIETIKDYLQFMRFLNMRTTFYPQSAIEISASVFFGLISRYEGMNELAERGYFARPKQLDTLLLDLQITEAEVENSTDELPFSLCHRVCS